MIAPTPQKDTYTVAHDFSFAEYVNLGFYQMSRMKIFRRMVVFMVAIGFLGGLLALLAPGKEKPMDLSHAAAYFLPLVILIIFFLVIIPLGCMFILRFRPQIIRGITYRFTHWGMERIGKVTEVTIPWRDFQKLKETKSFFFLFVREMVKENKVSNIHVIQKRMFSNHEDAREFITFLEQKVTL